MALDVVMLHLPSMTYAPVDIIYSNLHDSLGFGRGDASPPFDDLHAGGSLIFLRSGRILSSSWWRKGGLVRIPSIRKTFALENDAQY